MSLEEGHPADIGEALSITPFLHLIPKQEIAPLISSNGIAMVPDSEAITKKIVSPEAYRLRRAWNHHPDDFSEVLDEFVTQFSEFHDDELDAIRFKNPERVETGVKEESVERPAMPYLEKRLFDSKPNVVHENVASGGEADGNGNVLSSSTPIYTGRLSVRKVYDPSDLQHTKSHNDRYRKKFQKEYYKMFPQEVDYTVEVNQREPDENETINPRKRSISSEGTPSSEDNIPAKRTQHVVTLSQEELAIQAYHTLKKLISDIESEEIGSDDHSYWINIGDARVLSKSTLLLLHDNLIRVVDHRISEDVDVSQFAKIQDLCFNTVSSSRSSDYGQILEILQGDGENQDGTVLAYLHNCFISTIASRNILAILNGCYSDKVLFLDEHLTSVIQLVQDLVDELLLPLAAGQEKIKVVSISLKAQFTNLLIEICDILQVILSYLHEYSLDDTLLTKLEFLAIQIIFAEFRGKGNNTVLGLSNFELMRSKASEIIVYIYSSVVDQREFLLGEIISNFDKLPQQRLSARQYKLVQGGSVQNVSALIVKLVECCCSEFESDSISPQSLLEDSSSHSELQAIINESTKTADNVASLLVSKFTATSSPMSKSSLEFVVEDLLVFLPLPAWSGSTILLTSIMKTFLVVIQNSEAATTVETSMLEIIGMIAVRLLRIKVSTEVNELSIHSTGADFVQAKISFLSILRSLRDKAHGSKSSIAGKFLVVKFLSYLTPITEAYRMETKDDIDKALIAERDAAKKELSQMVFAICLIGSGKRDSELSISNQEIVEGLENFYISTILCQELTLLYENFLASLVSLMDSTKVKVRAKCIKILSSLIEEDVGLLLSNKIQESVSNRLFDSSPLVRDAVIDLINRYMISKPLVVDSFYQAICECLTDESVQVRKRVVKLSGQMYKNTASTTAKSYIAARILRRLEDEDDVVQDLATNILISLWLDTSLTANTTGKEAELRTEVEVMMDLVNGKSKTNEFFETFLLNHVVSNTKAGIKKSLQKIVDTAFDFVIEGKCIGRSMKLIALLVRCDTSLINQDQLISIEPFIIDEKVSEENTRYYSLDILSSALPIIDSLRPDFLSSLTSGLLKRLTKFSVKELHRAMPSVWTLCEKNKDTIKLANASISCMRLIRPYIETGSHNDQKYDVKLQKLLHLLGCFGRYCKLEKHRELFLKSNLGLKEKESVTSAIVKFLMFFCDDKMPLSIRNVALTNIIHVCRSHTKLFVSEPILKVLDKGLLAKDNLETAHTILQGLLKFLKEEDYLARKRNGSKEVSSDKVKLDVSVFHGSYNTFLNDGVCAGLIQRYQDRILELCLIDAGNFSLLPVQFLQLIIKLGFANPKRCIPTIIALYASPNPYITYIARDLHRELYEKHESLIDSSYIEAFNLAFKYLKSISVDTNKASNLYDDVYSVINKTYTAKKKFVQSLTRMLNIDSNLFDKGLAFEQEKSTIFKISNIANLDFGSYEEILTILSEIDQIVSRQGMHILERLKTVDEDEGSGYELEAYAALARTILACIALKEHLVQKYSISRSTMERFIPGRVDIELRQVPKTVLHNPFNVSIASTTSVAAIDRAEIIAMLSNEMEKFA
ncbi:sister chromatid cohesion C-terminus-domain-containing protein [Scheffersomyces xylosifermentans]|uniref:sister chromatid cohesion C-terminus-domain-containing protein n=1 Tax=Scheffersomyces xylosifermentans TaxID=1304137 RepID=UPI00315D5723